MNSDISYFGVGGKQAIFFIGNATRVGLKEYISSLNFYFCCLYLSYKNHIKMIKEIKSMDYAFVI